MPDGKILVGANAHYYAGYVAGWKAASDFFTGKGMGFEQAAHEMEKWDEFFYERRLEAERQAAGIK